MSMHSSASLVHSFTGHTLRRRIARMAFACLLSLDVGIAAAQSPPDTTSSAAVNATTAREAAPLLLAPLPPQDQPLLLQGANDTERTYLVPDDAPLLFSAPGPAVVELHSRAVFTDARQVLGYALRYRIDRGDAQHIDVGGIDRDLGRRFRSGVRGEPGYAIRHRITLPDGWHNLEIERGDVNQPVVVRAQVTPSQATPREWQPFDPLRPPPRVEAQRADGRPLQVYRFSEEKGLRLQPQLSGYMRVEVYSEHPPSQTAPFRYSIEVRLNGKALHLYHFLGQKTSDLRLRSGSTSAGSMKELIFYVDPGTGRGNNYLVRPVIGSGRSFLGTVEFVAAP